MTEFSFLNRILDREIKSFNKCKTGTNTDFKYRGFNCNIGDYQRIDDIYSLKGLIASLNEKELFTMLIFEKVSGIFLYKSIYEIDKYKSKIELIKDSEYTKFRILLNPKESTELILFACPENADIDEINTARENQRKYHDVIKNLFTLKNCVPSFFEKTDPIKMCIPHGSQCIIDFMVIHNISRYLQIYVNNESLTTLINGDHLIINTDDIKLFIGTKLNKNDKNRNYGNEKILVFSDSLNLDEYGNFVILHKVYKPDIIKEDNVEIEEFFDSINFDPNCPETFSIFLDENEIKCILDEDGFYMRISHQNVAVFIGRKE